MTHYNLTMQFCSLKLLDKIGYTNKSTFKNGKQHLS